MSELSRVENEYVTIEDLIEVYVEINYPMGTKIVKYADDYYDKSEIRITTEKPKEVE